jgi:hypothetical protein
MANRSKQLALQHMESDFYAASGSQDSNSWLWWLQEGLMTEDYI